MDDAPHFDDKFREMLHTLLVWRRDVRRFRRDPLPVEFLTRLLEAASLAPSVGLSQPWRLVIVDDVKRREAVRENFRRCNDAARARYSDEKAEHYANLKLSGLEEAPLQIAVFADRNTVIGSFLGRATMPETIEYSVIGAIHTMWLVARAEGVGLGWVSILEPQRLALDLDVPQDWHFVGYLCVGYPQAENDAPELEREGWEKRVPIASLVLKR